MREPPSVPFLGKKYRETVGLTHTGKTMAEKMSPPLRPPPTLGPLLLPSTYSLLT